MKINRLPFAAIAAASVMAVGCGKETPAERVPPPDARRVEQSKTGTIAGRVLVEGPVPESTTVNIEDPFCSREKVPVETVVVADGGLKNVFVYIKDGLDKYYFDVPAEPVKLDQHSCRYVPHVLGVRAGQALEISNSDATVHTVAASTKVNRAFNFSQPMQGLKNTATFNDPEVMVRMKCDVHGWMNAYVGVMAHPYFAVTENGGKFELKGVPAGTYTVEAWHEKFGTRTQNVTLGENGSQELSFTFNTQTTVP
jgi:hypothetical protein